MDVFGKLNDFLNNGEDDSIKYDVFDSPEMDILDVKETKSDVQSSQNKECPNDSVTIDDNSQKLRRSKRSRSKKSSQENSSQEDILDLTSPLVDVPNRRYNKSRRKLADTIPCHVEEQIDLCDAPTSSSAITTTSVRGKRGVKKAKAPRKISYKKALALINAPLPVLGTDLQNFPTEPNQLTPQRSRERQVDNFSVDLTGDIEISSIHNQNPLFQRTEVVKEKSNKKYQERYSLDFEEDLDQISLNVKVNGEIRKYRIKAEQHFYELFKMIAEDEDVPICNVVFFIGDKRIYPEDTPEIIGHRISSIYTCRLIDTVSNVKVRKKDSVEIKFQSDKWKRPISLTVSRFEPFSAHIQKLCTEVQFKPDQISLKFDGDDIDTSKSPIELDFEGGEIVDCRIKA